MRGRRGTKARVRTATPGLKKCSTGWTMIEGGSENDGVGGTTAYRWDTRSAGAREVKGSQVG